MKLHNVLLRHAAKLATSQTVRKVELYAEMGRLQAHPLTEESSRELEVLRAEADNCGQALRRFGRFRPEKVLSCPYCWIVKDERQPVEPAARSELYRCPSCNAEYSMT